MNGFYMILPFLKPIEHPILDGSISEAMVKGPNRRFIEKQGFIQQVPSVCVGERSLTVAVRNITRHLGHDISESIPILESRLPDDSRVATVILPSSLRGVTPIIRQFNIRHFEMDDPIRTTPSTANEPSTAATPPEKSYGKSGTTELRISTTRCATPDTRHTVTEVHLNLAIPRSAADTNPDAERFAPEKSEPSF